MRLELLLGSYYAGLNVLFLFFIKYSGAGAVVVVVIGGGGTGTVPVDPPDVTLSVLVL